MNEKYKSRYLVLECAATYLALLSVMLLFGKPLARYIPGVGLGLAAGFAFSWLDRGRKASWTPVFINAGLIAVFVWMIRSIMNSSFLYKEVILTAVKAGFFIEVLLSFNGTSLLYLGYMQALSVPLFMCPPIFLKQFAPFNILLVSMYLFFWICIAKAKFYMSFSSKIRVQSAQAQGVRRQERYYPYLLLAVVLAIILLASRFLFYHFMLQRVEGGGILGEEGFETKVQEAALEKEYYAVQDKLQTEMSGFLPDVKNANTQQEILYLFSSLIKESPDLMEVKEAEQGLIDRLRRPGPGAQPAGSDTLTVLIKDYVDRKISMDLRRNKDAMMQVLKNTRLRAKERIGLIERFNKLHYDNSSHRQTQRHASEANRLIENSPASGAARGEMKEALRRMEGLKALEFYRREKEALEKAIEGLQGALRGQMERIVSDIDRLQGVSDARDIEERLQGLKPVESKQEKDAVKRAGDLLDLRLELLMGQESGRLKQEVEQAGLPDDTGRLLREEINDGAGARDTETFKQSVEKIRAETRGDFSSGADKAVKRWAEAKAHILLRESRQRAARLLKDGILPDSGQEFLEELRSLSLDKDTKSAASAVDKAKEKAEELFSQGFIQRWARDALVKEIEAGGRIIALRGELREDLEAKARRGAKEQLVRQSELEESIEQSFLSEKKKIPLRRLSGELAKASSLAQLENVRDAIVKEIENLLEEFGEREDIRRLSEQLGEAVAMRRLLVADAALSGLRESLQTLSRVDQQKAQELRKRLERIRDVTVPAQARQEIEKLKAYISGEKQQERTRSAPEEGAAWDIRAVPARLVIPVGGAATFQAVGIYRQLLAKTLHSELQSVSFDPGIAEADKDGSIRGLAVGEARIGVGYRGKAGEEIEVAVVERIPEETRDEVSRAAALAYQDTRIAQGGLFITLNRRQALARFGTPDAAAETASGALWEYSVPERFFVYFSRIAPAELYLYPENLDIQTNYPVGCMVLGILADGRPRDVTASAAFLATEKSKPGSVTEGIAFQRGGIVIAQAEGEYRVLAKYNKGFSNPAYVRVTREARVDDKERLLAINILPQRPVILPGSNFGFRALGTFYSPQTGQYLVRDISRESTWHLEREGTLVNTFKDNNIRFPQTEGRYTLTCRHKGMESFSQEAEISPNPSPSGSRLKHLTLLPEFATMKVGQTIQMYLFGTRQNNRVEDFPAQADVQWKMSVQEPLSFSGNARFAAQAIGLSDISAVVENAESAPARITVMRTQEGRRFMPPEAAETQEKKASAREAMKDVQARVEELGRQFSQSAERKLGAIKIAPDNLKISVGESKALIATGVYDDASQEDLTLVGAWSVSDSAVLGAAQGKVSAYAPGEAKVRVRFRDVTSEPATVQVEGPKLISIIVSPKEAVVPMREKVRFKAEGFFTDNSRKDITDLVSWSAVDPKVLEMRRSEARPRRFGRTEVYAEHARVRSLPVSVRVIFTWDWFLIKLLQLLAAALAAALAAFAACFVVTERKKRILLNMLRDDPKGFIVSLYQNARDILSIFGCRPGDILPPLAFAELADARYGTGSVFLSLTKTFEEAKYSRHAITHQHGRSSLKDYNNFLQALRIRHGRAYLFFRYCLTVFMAKPFSIKGDVSIFQAK